MQGLSTSAAVAAMLPLGSSAAWSRGLVSLPGLAAWSRCLVSRLGRAARSRCLILLGPTQAPALYPTPCQPLSLPLAALSAPILAEPAVNCVHEHKYI